MGAEALRIGRKDAPYTVLPLMTLITYYVVHYYGFLSIQWYQLGFFTVTVFHAIQYMGLGWMLEDRTKSDATLPGRLMTMVPSWASFWLFWLSLGTIAWVWENSIATSINSIWASAASCLLLAVSAHHYTVDTRIWRRAAGA